LLSKWATGGGAHGQPWLRHFDLLLSVPLMLEYEKVLKQADIRAQSHLTMEEVDVLLDMLAAVGTPHTPSFHWRPQLPRSRR